MNRVRVVSFISLVLSLLAAWAADYMLLPAWNLSSFGAWMFVAIFAPLVLCSLLGIIVGQSKDGLKLVAVVGIGLPALVVAAAALLMLGSSRWWPGNAARYYARLVPTQKSFEDFSKDFPGEGVSGGSDQLMLLPALDKELSRTIAQGKMGPYGAQFQIDSDIFTSLSVQREGKPVIVRAAPLEYASLTVALSSAATGTAGYIEVDQQTGEGRLVEGTSGLRYLPTAYFGRYLGRALRSAYRTELLGSWSFELNDEGEPFWAVPVQEATIGLFGGMAHKGLILMDARSGSHAYYPAGSEPEWVDRSLPVDLVKEQANDYLGLKNGLFNLILGSRQDVFQLSDSYAYVVVTSSGRTTTWFVSGITSPNEADQTLIGLMMVNLSTGEARRYAMNGITEMRAMDIAMNDERVRAQALMASWPFIVDVDGTPAFAMILKNDLQRQRFAYVDVATGNRVAMADTREAARAQFVRLAGGTKAAEGAVLKVQGMVLRVKDAPQEDTVYFILQGDLSALYAVKARSSLGAYFLAPGDQVLLEYRESGSAEGMRFVENLRNLSIGE